MLEFIHILLVEDSHAEAYLTREALNEWGQPYELTVLDNGEDAMLFLLGQEPFSGRRAPDFVLLDLNLPRKDGRQVLREAKSNPAVAGIPIIVLSNSKSEDDRNYVYDWNANCFLQKPENVEDFFSLIRGTANFWGRKNGVLPTHERQ